MNDRFGSTARDFAAGIVTREGGTPEDVRELSYGPDLDRIVSDHRAEFDWNTVPGMGARVRDWYAEQFPDDSLGGMIAPDVTFAQTVESLHGGDVYDRLGVGDSVVRERVFDELSARIGCGYEDIYDAWLNGDGLDPRLVSDRIPNRNDGSGSTTWRCAGPRHGPEGRTSSPPSCPTGGSSATSSPRTADGCGVSRTRRNGTLRAPSRATSRASSTREAGRPPS